MKKKNSILKNLKKKNSLKQAVRKSGNNRGLQNKIIRGSKTQKGKSIPFKLYHNFGIVSNFLLLRNRRYVLKALEATRLSAHEIEAGRRIIKKAIGKNFYLVLHVYPFVPLTKRPSDVRMGKGKGTRIVDWIYPIKAGKIIYELKPRFKRRKRKSKIKMTMVEFFRDLRAVQSLSLACKKFSISTKVLILKN
jgi:ribosomal protein L16